MKKILRFLPLLLSLLAACTLAACDALTGKEVARMPINALSDIDKVVMQEAHLDLQAGEEITFLAAMDMVYDTQPELLFRVEIQQEGIPTGILQMDPLAVHVTLREVRTSFGGEVKWRYEGKMESMKAEVSGAYTFRAMLIGNVSPAFVLNKAELVIRK